MIAYFPAILLAILNVFLIWSLLAAPVGKRTLIRRMRVTTDADHVWNAVHPARRYAEWRNEIVSSLALPGEEAVVEQVFAAPYRQDKPIRRRLLISEEFSDNQRRLDFSVIEDSALDISFWKNFRECIIVEREGDDEVLLTIERTDCYRGVAFPILRYFTLRRELKALGQWLATGQTKPARFVFEHPAVQMALAVVSTLLLWPFFGLSAGGLLLSTLLTIVIVVHEFGHMAAYRAFGHPSTRMIFVPLLGGVAIGGRPYNSLFEVASCALMGAGMSAFLVPVLIALHQGLDPGEAGAVTASTLLFFLLILGAFNLLNLLPMNRFDGGQVLRQVFPGSTSLALGSFVVTAVILSIGWRIGVPHLALITSLAVFALLSLMGQKGVKPRHKLNDMTSSQRLLSGFGLYAALSLHGYAVIYATDRLFS